MAKTRQTDQTMTDRPPLDIKVHAEPVWRQQANFIIQARVEHEAPREIREQLWARQLAADRFEICCIPFFVFDLALGDEVEAALDQAAWIVQRVVKPSGRQTYWVWFNESATTVVRKQAEETVSRLGCLREWYSKQLLALDVVSEEQATSVINAFMDEQRQGLLEIVSSRTDQSSPPLA